MINKFQEAEALLMRADEHLKWLRDFVVHPDANLSASNAGYYFLPQSGDLFAAKVRVVVGECASCLRNALNYLTCAVAEQDSRAPATNSVQFPLESCPNSFIDNRNRFLRGVADEHVAFFEQFQPYKTGKPFHLLRDLSNTYRHRELVRVQQDIQWIEGSPTPSETYRLPAGHEVRVDRFTVAVSLADRTPIVQALEEIQRRVREAVQEFRKPLARYVSEHIEDFL
jgi:hypothetical protein